MLPLFPCLNHHDLVVSTIPDGVIRIGAGAFSGCTSLAGLYFEGDAPILGGDDPMFYQCPHVVLYYRPGTTDWVSTVEGRPTALWVTLTLGDPPMATAGPLKLHSSSPAPATFFVQRSTNLRDWQDWQTISRTEGPSQLQDTEAATTPYRFYRAVKE